MGLYSFTFSEKCGSHNMAACAALPNHILRASSVRERRAIGKGELDPSTGVLSVCSHLRVSMAHERHLWAAIWQGHPA